MENIQSFVSSLFNNNNSGPPRVNNSHTTTTTTDTNDSRAANGTNSSSVPNNNNNNSNSLSSSASELLHAFQTALWNGGIAPPDILNSTNNRGRQQHNQQHDHVTEQFLHHQQQAHQQAQNQHHHAQQQQQQQQHSLQQKIPPVSLSVLEHLPIITMTKDDLIDPMNRQCSICFNDIILQQKVIRLIPYCGHTFCCKDCIVPWLQKSATCPICRYELPTSAGYQYEVERKARMKLRKPRLAKYELYRMSTSQLQDIIWMNDQPLNNTTLPHFVEKQDIIDYIISSNDQYIDWIIPSDPVKYTVSQLQGMSISQLKKVMNDEAGLFYDKNDNILEKDDMLRYFLVSGRLEIIPEVEVKNKNNDVEKTSSSVIVETVNENNDNDNTDSIIINKKKNSEQQNDEDISTTMIDTRSDPTVLMEENISYSNNNVNINEGNELHHHEKVDDTNNNSPNVLLNRDIRHDSCCTGATIPAEDGAAFNDIHSQSLNCSENERQQQNDHDECNITTTSYQDNNNLSTTEIMMDVEYETEKNSNHSLNDDMYAEDDRSTNSLLEENNDEIMMNDIHSNDDEHKEEEISTNDSINNDTTSIRVTDGSEYNRTNNDSNNDNDATIRVTGSFQDRSLTDLKALAKELNINLKGCLERNDIVERIINHISTNHTNTSTTTSTEQQQQQQQRRPAAAGFAVASNDDNNNFDLSILQSDIFGITELRMITEILHIDTTQCLMTCKDSIVIAIYEAAMNDRPYIIQCLQSLNPLTRKNVMTVSVLRLIAKEWNINISDCIEKNEMIQKLIVYKIHSML